MWNDTRGALLAGATRCATTPWSRTIGLLGRGSLAPGEGLYIARCGSVHTWFMRFTIDVLYLDVEGHVVKTAHALSPFRFSWGGRRARSVIELPAGMLTATGTVPGDHVSFAPATR